MYSDGNLDFIFSAVEESERIRIICTFFSVLFALSFQKAVPCFFVSRMFVHNHLLTICESLNNSSISVKETEELLLWWSNQSMKMGRTFETRKGAVFGDKYPDRE